MPHKVLVFAGHERGEEVARRLTAGGFGVALVGDMIQCAALARQQAPSVLVLVTNAADHIGREIMATLTMEPATAALPLIVVSPAAPLADALMCFQGGIAGLFDIERSAEQLAAQVRDLVGPEPGDPRARQAVAPGGGATLRRIGRYMQSWELTAALKISGPPAGDATISWDGGMFATCSYNGLAANQAAAALLQLSGPGAWRFQVDQSGQPPHGEVTEDSLELIIDLLPEDKLASSLPEGGPVDLDDGLKVLLVDDDPSLLAMYERAFKGRGWSVQTSTDGAAGYRAAIAQHPDLIVSDIMMPDTDGWGFLGLIRGDFRVRETPFVMMSCHSDFLSKLRALDAGADDYLEKGLRLSLVMERLEAVVLMRRQLRAAIAPGQAFGGQLITVGAQFLLRLLAEQNVTGRLSVTTRWGTIEVSHERGVITDARYSAGTGEEEQGIHALEALLSLDDGHFSFSPQAPVHGGFDTPFDSVVDEVCATLNARREEADRDMFTRNDPLICANTRLRDFYLATCGEIVRPIATALFAGQPPRDVLAHSDASPVLVEAVVKDVLGKGIAKFEHQSAPK